MSGSLHVPLTYPFSAVLGCDVELLGPAGMEPMGLALVLTAISPEIGGVLVRGEKGTAKSTTVRALADVLPPVRVFEGDRFSIDPDDSAAHSPDGPFPSGAVSTRGARLVELPVGATEDRVLGALNLEKALTAGAVEFEPGLLARAHRGLLYVDEVNLLHDHLVDLLLDAAATGRVTVERDGVSISHAARFLLVGTMNPEEGELRPQLLDRFGLTVEVAAPREAAQRVEVVRRRLAFDSDPVRFCDGFAAKQAALTERIEAARHRLAAVDLSDAALLLIAEICAAFEVDGLRADIVTARTASAHAAWLGHSTVTKADIRAAALLALPHRRRRNPFDAPGLDEELLDRLLDGSDLPEPPDQPEDSDQPEPPGQQGPDDDAAGGEDTDAGAADTPTTTEQPDPADHGEDAAPEQTEQPAPPTPTGAAPEQPAVSAGKPYRPRLLSVDGLGEGSPGRRSRALSSRGRKVGSTAGAHSLHLLDTLRAAAERTALRGQRRTGALSLHPDDLRSAIREGRESNLLMFVVDASGSMAARRRMSQVKTAILSLLTDAYRRRDRVALVTFRGTGAELALPPTGSIDTAVTLLDTLPSGGRTPLAEGLLEAGAVVRRELLRDPRMRPLLIVVTDGRATAGPEAVTRSRLAADQLARLGLRSVVIDCESGPMRLGLARRLAGHLSAEHLPMEQVDAAGLVGVVTERVA
jgi:magnesium chelatase subunit D